MPSPAKVTVQPSHGLTNDEVERLVLESVEHARADFHARRSAKFKTYQYRIFRREVCPPFIVNYVHHHPYPLGIDSMKEAARLVAGEHDFTSFAAVDPEKRTVEVFTAPDQSTTVEENGVLDGGDVLPGFSLAVSEWFARAGARA